MNRETLDSLSGELSDALDTLRRVQAGIERMYSELEPPSDKRWMVYPLPIAYPVTSEFGDGAIKIRPTIHEGVDFGTPIGVSVLACADGRVVSAQFNTAYGFRVRIEHVREGERWWTWYCHLYAMVHEVGDVVRAGDVVGLSGATGNVTGPHLHLTLQRESNPLLIAGLPEVLRGCVDPRDWVVWK